MSSPAEPSSVQRWTPEAVFSLLSSAVRVDIVQALGAADGPVSFSALREAVDVDDSGKFNYHLRKLVGSFVVHDDSGYVLSLAGRRVYGAILSGAYTADASVEPFEFDGPCPVCGSDVLVAEYADERARLSCPGCEEWCNEFSFPPATLDQFAREELPAAFDRWMRGTVAKVLEGFCTNCGGRVDGQLRHSDDGPAPVRAVFDCGRCGDELTASPLLPTLFDPTAVAFFASHGVDVFSDPSWQYFDASADTTVELVDEDPLRVAISILLDGAEFAATVGPDVTVEEATTRPVGDG